MAGRRGEKMGRKQQKDKGKDVLY